MEYGCARREGGWANWSAAITRRLQHLAPRADNLSLVRTDPSLCSFSSQWSFGNIIVKLLTSATKSLGRMATNYSWIRCRQLSCPILFCCFVQSVLTICQNVGWGFKATGARLVSDSLNTFCTFRVSSSNLHPESVHHRKCILNKKGRTLPQKCDCTEILLQYS